MHLAHGPEPNKKGYKMKVSNMTSSKGNKVTNQFIISGEHKGCKGMFFQSYDTVIAFKPASGASIVLDKKYWDYSKNTRKYRNQFLNDTKKETEQKIKSGAYILADLNQ